MKRDFGHKIRELMVACGIKTAKGLADRINEEAGEQLGLKSLAKLHHYLRRGIDDIVTLRLYLYHQIY